MTYWDSSALVPLVVDEPSTGRMRELLSEDTDVTTWIWTRTEVISAIERRVREGQIPPLERRSVLDRLDELASGWDEITEILAVRSRANALLARHALRAADAGQLGAALQVQERTGQGLAFVTRDRRLALAAEREGFRVLEAADRSGVAAVDSSPASPTRRSGEGG